jgi:hypothetical protein
MCRWRLRSVIAVGGRIVVVWYQLDDHANLIIDRKPFVEQIEENLRSRSVPLKERDDSYDSGNEGGHKGGSLLFAPAGSSPPRGMMGRVHQNKEGTQGS